MIAVAILILGAEIMLALAFLGVHLDKIAQAIRDQNEG